MTRACRHRWVITTWSMSRGAAVVRVKCLDCGKRQRWLAALADRALADVSKRARDDRRSDTGAVVDAHRTASQRSGGTRPPDI